MQGSRAGSPHDCDEWGIFRPPEAVHTGENDPKAGKVDNIPNFITVLRLFLVPAIVAMIASHSWWPAFTVFAVAGISDGVDGFIARRFDMRSELGAYLDPLADKALLMSIYVALAIAGILPGWIAILVVSRDVMIVGAVVVSWVLDRPVEIRPLWVSKLNTATQITFAGAVLAAMAFGFSLEWWFDTLLALVAALTLASTAAYLTQWLRHMSA
jgi:cardiolipin synthase